MRARMKCTAPFACLGRGGRGINLVTIVLRVGGVCVSHCQSIQICHRLQLRYNSDFVSQEGRTCRGRGWGGVVKL